MTEASHSKDTRLVPERAGGLGRPGAVTKGVSQNAVLGPPSLQFKQTWNACRMSGLYSLPVANTAMENLSLSSVCCATLDVGLKKNPGDEVSGETRKGTSTHGGGCCLG